MKSLKTYLILMSILLCIAIGCGVYVWYLLQDFDRDVEMVAGTEIKKVIPQDGENDTHTETQSLQAETVTNAPVTTQEVDETTSATSSISIDTTKLGTSQKTVLKSIGLTGDTVTITEAMLTCAKDALGEARVGAIIAGDAPSPLESLQLVGCVDAR